MAVGFKTGGRKKGSRNKLNVLVSEAAAGRADYVIATRKSLTEMRYIAQWHMDRAKEAEAKVDENGKPAPDLALASQHYQVAYAEHKGIAEYEFPKLSALTVQGDPNRPQVTRIEVELVESRHEPSKVIEHKPLDTV